MECPKYFYFRVKPNRHGTVVEIEDASDADVVEVVRCKDCKYWVTVVDNAEYGLCAAIKSDIGVRGRNEYCSRSKRREDDSDKD